MIEMNFSPNSLSIRFHAIHAKYDSGPWFGCKHRASWIRCNQENGQGRILMAAGGSMLR